MNITHAITVAWSQKGTITCPIAKLTFKILPDCTNATLEVVRKCTVTSLSINNAEIKEANLCPGPAMAVIYSRGSAHLVVELEQGGRNEIRGILQMLRCSRLGFIRSRMRTDQPKSNPPNVQQLYLMSFRCSCSYSGARLQVHSPGCHRCDFWVDFFGMSFKYCISEVANRQ